MEWLESTVQQLRAHYDLLDDNDRRQINGVITRLRDRRRELMQQDKETQLRKVTKALQEGTIVIYRTSPWPMVVREVDWLNRTVTLGVFGHDSSVRNMNGSQPMYTWMGTYWSKAQVGGVTYNADTGMISYQKEYLSLQTGKTTLYLHPMNETKILPFHEIANDLLVFTPPAHEAECVARNEE